MKQRTDSGASIERAAAELLLARNHARLAHIKKLAADKQEARKAPIALAGAATALLADQSGGTRWAT